MSFLSNKSSITAWEKAAASLPPAIPSPPDTVFVIKLFTAENELFLILGTNFAAPIDPSPKNIPSPVGASPLVTT